MRQAIRNRPFAIFLAALVVAVPAQPQAPGPQIMPNYRGK